MTIKSIYCLLLFLLFEAARSESDQQHKVMKSIVELEHDHEVMRYLLRNYQQLEDTNAETAKILNTISETMQDVQDQLSRIDESNKETASMLTSLGRSVGATYTRWGRATCPETNTTFVYAGHVGGSHYTHSGAASNYLCLTREPTWNEHQVEAAYITYLHGGEYDFYNHKTFGKGLDNLEPPCAVCRSPRSTVIMIPGRNVCLKGWVTEYSGYLVAGYPSHAAASEFICLDAMAVAAADSNSAADNGKLMYTVRASCGSLKCPPYKNNWTVTCVVCSK